MTQQLNLKQLVRDEDGQNLIEYALIAALVSLACILSLSTLGKGIAAAFNQLMQAAAAAM